MPVPTSAVGRLGQRHAFVAGSRQIPCTQRFGVAHRRSLHGSPVLATARHVPAPGPSLSQYVFGPQLGMTSGPRSLDAWEQLAPAPAVGRSTQVFERTLHPKPSAEEHSPAVHGTPGPRLATHRPSSQR